MKQQSQSFKSLIAVKRSNTCTEEKWQSANKDNEKPTWDVTYHSHYPRIVRDRLHDQKLAFLQHHFNKKLKMDDMMF